jgi:pyruvate formate lyase activating enzyme
LNGLVFDIKRFALHDGPGIRTTVFLKGCPLRCWWCQNPESIRDFPETLQIKSITPTFNNSCIEEKIFGNEINVDSLIKELIKDRIFYDESGGGVTFSGGEPLVQADFLVESLKLCKKIGINTAVDTSGYTPFENIEKIYDSTDLFLFDLKIFDDEKHIKFTDVSNKLILSNIKKLTDIGNKTIVRIPLIPGITDTNKNLLEVSRFVSTLKNIKQIDLLPYNKISESKYKRFNVPSLLSDLQTQTEEKLFEIKSMFDELDTKISLRG